MNKHPSETDANTRADTCATGDPIDQRIATGLLRRSQGALAEAFQRHGAAVVGQARAQLGNAAAAEDVAQEVFLALWHDPGRFDPARGSLRAYLVRLAQRRAIDHYRSEAARRRRQDRFGHQTPNTRSLEDIVAGDDHAARIRTALGSLPRAEREAIDLAFFGHHTYQEVSRLLAQPEGTIKSRIRTGLRRLRTTEPIVLEAVACGVR